VWYCPGGVLTAPHRPPGFFPLLSVCPFFARNVQLGNLALCPGTRAEVCSFILRRRICRVGVLLMEDRSF